VSRDKRELVVAGVGRIMKKSIKNQFDYTGGSNLQRSQERFIDATKSLFQLP
jgi:hypothetical protein